jgi:hypothetical protein
MLHAGFRASFARKHGAGFVKDVLGRTTTTADEWLVAYSDVEDVEPLIRTNYKQQEAPELADASDRRQFAALAEPYTGRTWCFDMSSAPGREDGFVVVRRAARELKPAYDKRVHEGTTATRDGWNEPLDACRATSASDAAVTDENKHVELNKVCLLDNMPMRRATNAKWVVTHASAPTIQANCHIDTAWLWPYAETRRKV